VWEAAADGDAQAVAAWLDEGGGVDARLAEHGGVTLLMAAASGGQEAMVRMLLQRGAGVNLQDSNGVTALMDAALRGHTTVVQALLDAKADTLLRYICTLFTRSMQISMRVLGAALLGLEHGANKRCRPP
jgi:ankyrin repeat protein